MGNHSKPCIIYALSTGLDMGERIITSRYYNETNRVGSFSNINKKQ